MAAGGLGLRWRALIIDKSPAGSRQRGIMPQRKGAGGRQSEQPPNYHHPKLFVIYSAVGSAHQELDATATNEHVRTYHQPSQILVCEESATNALHCVVLLCIVLSVILLHVFYSIFMQRT